MRRKLYWKASANDDRTQIIEKVKKLISQHDGYIAHFNLFSDLALSLCIEIEEKQIAGFHEDLKDFLVINEIESDLNPHSIHEWWVFMNISFAQGSGKLKRGIPHVPG